MLRFQRREVFEICPDGADDDRCLLPTEDADNIEQVVLIVAIDGFQFSRVKADLVAQKHLHPPPFTGRSGFLSCFAAESMSWPIRVVFK